MNIFWGERKAKPKWLGTRLVQRCCEGQPGPNRRRLEQADRNFQDNRSRSLLNKGLEVNGSVPVLSHDLTHPREDILSVVMLSPSPRETTTPRRSGYRRSYPIHPIFRVRPSLFGRLSTGWLPIQPCSLVSAEILQACGVRGRRRRRRRWWRRRRRVHLLPQQQQRRIRHVLRPFPDVRPARRIGRR